MRPLQVRRSGAAALGLGGLLAVAGQLVTPLEIDVVTFVQDPRFLPGHLLVVAGSLLILLGLPAAYGWAAERLGVSGLVGFGGVMLGVTLFGVFVSLLFGMVLPWTVDVMSAAQAEQGPPALGIFFPVAGIITTLGAILFGLAIARSAVYSAWLGYLLILAGVVQFLMGALGENVGIPEMGVLIIEKVADIAFFLSLGWLGVELWSHTRERTAGQERENRASPELSQAV